MKYLIDKIKVGDNYKKIREKIKKTKWGTVGPLPSFCNSNYLVAQDLETKEKIYLLVENGIITNITQNVAEVYDMEEAEKTLDFILNN